MPTCSRPGIQARGLASSDFGSAPRRWLGLKVLRHESAGDGAAIVEFIARYKAGGRAHEFREVSRFVREEGRWLYVDGDTSAGGN